MTCASFSACRPRILVESPFNGSCRNARHHLDTYTRPLAVAMAKAQSRFVQDTQKFMTCSVCPYCRGALYEHTTMFQRIRKMLHNYLQTLHTGTMEERRRMQPTIKIGGYDSYTLMGC